MTKKIDLAVLSAYVDGELSGEDVGDVEAFLRHNPNARQAVKNLREESAAIKGAYNELLIEALPPETVSTVNRAFQTTNSANQPPAGETMAFWRLVIPYAAVATFAAIFLGGPIGYYLAVQQTSREVAQHEAQHSADKKAMAEAMLEALESHVSGRSANWENPESGSRGSITPVRTFKNKDGSWCREYRETSNFIDRREERRAIACRTSDGIWKTRLISYEES